MDVRLANGDVETAVDRDATSPQAGIRVRQREPPAVLLDAKEDRVVHDAAILGRDQHVLALADRALRQVATRQRVRELARVRSRDLDDSLDADVPEGDAVEEGPVLLDRVGVVAGQVHVVVDVVRAAACRECLLEERRASEPRSEVEGRGGRGLRDGAGGCHRGAPPAPAPARDRASARERRTPSSWPWVASWASGSFCQPCAAASPRRRDSLTSRTDDRPSLAYRSAHIRSKAWTESSWLEYRPGV